MAILQIITLTQDGMIKPGDQITVTVETVFDGGFVTFYQDPSGNEHRGALLVDEKQMADSLAR